MRSSLPYAFSAIDLLILIAWVIVYKLWFPYTEYYYFQKTNFR